MRNFLLFIMLFTVSSAGTQAQKKSKQLWMGAGMAQSLQNDLHTGYSFDIKGMYGLSKNGQLTLTASFARLPVVKGLFNDKYGHVRVISVQAGYRHHIGRFFIEPQAGIGETGGRVLLIEEGDVARPSVAAAITALNIGYTMKRFSVGIRIFSAQGIEKPEAGIWYDRDIYYAGIFVAYRLFAGNK